MNNKKEEADPFKFAVAVVDTMITEDGRPYLLKVKDAHSSCRDNDGMGKGTFMEHLNSDLGALLQKPLDQEGDKEIEQTAEVEELGKDTL